MKILTMAAFGAALCAMPAAGWAVFAAKTADELKS